MWVFIYFRIYFLHCLAVKQLGGSNDSVYWAKMMYFYAAGTSPVRNVCRYGVCGCDGWGGGEMEDGQGSANLLEVLIGRTSLVVPCVPQFSSLKTRTNLFVQASPS